MTRPAGKAAGPLGHRRGLRLAALGAAVLSGSVASLLVTSISAADTPVAPAFTSASAATFTVGTPGSFQVTASGTPAPTLTQIQGSFISGLSWSPSTDTLSGTPSAGAGGQYGFIFEATNSAGYAFQVLTVTVQQAPAVTSATTTTFVVGASGTFAFTASGYPAPTLTETGTLPSGLSITNDLLSGVPDLGTDGSYPITVTASNGVGTDASQNFTLVVATVPVFTSAAAATFTVGSPGTFSVTATGDPAPTFSLVPGLPLPAGLTLSSDGTLSGTPAQGTAGLWGVGVEASNGSGPVVQGFQVTVLGAPTFSSAAQAGLAIGQPATVDVVANGNPAPTLSESGTLPADLTFTPASSSTSTQTTGTLTGTPTAADEGIYHVSFGATNGQTPDASQAFTLVIGNAPTFVSPVSTGFPAHVSTSFTVATTAWPTPTLAVTSKLPRGLSFTDNGDGTGTISGATSISGVHNVTVKAVNAVGTTTETLSLVVGSPPVFKSLPAAAATVGKPMKFVVKTRAYPRSLLTLSSGALPAGITFTDFGNGNGTMSGTAQPGTDGTYPITFAASNGQGPPVTQIVTLTVTG